MTPRLRVLTGLITVIIYLGIGAVMYDAGARWIGGALVALGLLRLVLWLRQLRLLRGEEPDEDEDEE